MRAYLAQVDHYAGEDDDEDFALHLENTEGPVLEALVSARTIRRADLLDEMTHVEDGVRVFTEDADDQAPAQARASQAWRRRSGPTSRRSRASKRFDRELFYDLRDVVGKSGFGIGSAGLPAYNLLVEGYSQALDNDVVLSMKQANIPALSRFADSAAVDQYFEHEGHRTVVSQRALQVHTDPLLGYAEMDGVGYVVAEVSPYEVDLDWENITEPDDMAAVVDLLGRATAKVHCASDEDSDQDLVDFQVEAAIVASLQGPTSCLHRPHRRLRPVVRRDGCAATTRCSSTPSAAGASASPRPRLASALEPQAEHRAPGLGDEEVRLAPAAGDERRRHRSLHRVDPLDGHQRDGRAAEATAGHPGAQSARLARGLDGDVELLAGDLVVVAQGGVRGVHQRPERRPSRPHAAPRRTRRRARPR